MEGDPLVQERVRVLLDGQLDVAADRAATDLSGAAIRRLHDAGTASRDHGEAGSGEPGTELPGHGAVRIVLVEARRAEDGHARAREVQGTKATHELDGDADRSDELEAARLRPLEEAANLRRSCPLPPPDHWSSHGRSLRARGFSGVNGQEGSSPISTSCLTA
jgi:hypothetical protein